MYFLNGFFCVWPLICLLYFLRILLWHQFAFLMGHNGQPQPITAEAPFNITEPLPTLPLCQLTEYKAPPIYCCPLCRRCWLSPGCLPPGWWGSPRGTWPSGGTVGHSSHARPSVEANTTAGGLSAEGGRQEEGMLAGFLVFVEINILPGGCRIWYQS